jgi:hypothetical protein
MVAVSGYQDIMDAVKETVAQVQEQKHMRHGELISK